MPMIVCDQPWGGTDCSDNMLHIEFVRDAVYIPWNEHETWGIYNAGGWGVPSGTHSAGPQNPYRGRLDLSNIIVDDEIEEAVYCGFIEMHFGHFLLSGLSRFWPALSINAMPPILCHGRGNPNEWQSVGYIPEILTQIGVDVRSIRHSKSPLRIRRLHVPQPCIVEQNFITGTYFRLCQKVGQQLSVQRDSDDCPIYVSKTRLSTGVGKIDQEELICEEMERSGVRVVHLQDHAFGEQIGILSRSRAILGMASSAFHTTMFGDRNRRIIALNASEGINSNMLLVDQAMSNDAIYLYQEGTKHERGVAFQSNVMLPDPVEAARALIDRI